MSSELVSRDQGLHLSLMARQKGVTARAWQRRQADLMNVVDAVRDNKSIIIGDPRTEMATIEIPALKRPTPEELAARFDWFRSVERDTSLEEAVSLSWVLQSYEDPSEPVSLGWHWRELASGLGFQHREWLFEHRYEHPEIMRLFRLRHVEFQGLIVNFADWSRCYPALIGEHRFWRPLNLA